MDTSVILHVDDNDDDNVLLLEACRKRKVRFRSQVAEDGQYAIDYLDGAAARADRTRFPLPDLILLDLKMPRKNGFEVLEWLQERTEFRRIPVAVLTASQNSDDIEKTYSKGATWFLMKPIRFEDLLTLVEVLDQWVRARDNLLLATLPFYRAAATKNIPA